ncbi:Acyl-CoA synthetase (AMP-forming)/AMP-acid ligase II [Parafrankia irregularis]|uniref:Acyl-CoA synthetase (AMP-forming)/AMP-acid ligase II n=1 Tax=Parafrankia irregularis TaxID=795642 RepID=A0A0S4QX26_9ACTN|nr:MULTISPECIES: AMP-binding protein [Parafrankia]MBE3199937.1 AMP-binding protein [Parafrankia sp. CH37]CUU59320.1 Acyl-CoA synthetase (AMP-forming)/AMP-acid ligase II [Parafrankia irregularis]
MGGTTVWGLVERAARLHPDNVVFADDHGRSLTVMALRDEAERVAAGLWAAGLGPGAVVSWQLPSILEAVVLMAACARLGVTQNPLIPLLREREVGFITGQVRTELLVVPQTWRGFAHGEMARALGVPTLVLDLEARPGAGIRLPGADSADPVDLPPPPEPESADAVRWLYYSSGTTSDPKGARHTDASMIASANGIVEHTRLRDGDVHPIAWPFAHIGGVAMLVAALRAGGRHVLFDAFDPATTPERMAAHGMTILGSATPFFLAYIAAQRRHGGTPLFGRLRACTSGGAAVPGTVNREVAEILGVRGVTGAWGLTEFPVATSESPDDPLIGTSVGHAVHGVSVRAVDGELRLKGPQCFQGYVDASLDEGAFDEDGWFRTGDLGSVDEHGRVRVLGRIKDVIIRNAENISALDVEEALIRHPAVADVAVVGVPDERTGERVCAVVVPAPGGEAAVTVTVAALAEHCLAAGLARYKCPEQIHLMDTLPRNAMGKILKNELRAAVTAARERRGAHG